MIPLFQERQHLWLRKFYKESMKKWQRVNYEEVIFGVLVSKLKLSKISTCFTCLNCLNNWNTRTMCKICWNLTIKTPEWRHWRRFGGFSFNFEQISHIFMVFLLTLNKYMPAAYTETLRSTKFCLLTIFRHVTEAYLKNQNLI